MVELIMQEALNEMTGGKGEELVTALQQREDGWGTLNTTIEKVRAAFESHNDALKQTEEASRAACDILRGVATADTDRVKALEREVEACQIARTTLSRAMNTMLDGTMAIAQVFPTDVQESLRLREEERAAAQAELIRTRDNSENDE